MSTERLDLRTATPEELERLPGIGPARARSIVRLRDKRRLHTVRDLRRIHGIGPKTIRRLRPLVFVSPAVRADEASRVRGAPVTRGGPPP